MYLQLLWGEVVELEEDVILLRSAAATLSDLDGHAAGHHVPGGQVLHTQTDIDNNSRNSSVVDPDPNCADIKDPDPNSLFLDPQHCHIATR